MKQNRSLYVYAFFVFFLAFIDEVFPHIYRLPPILLVGCKIHVIYLIRSFVAMLQWLILLVYFQQIKTVIKQTATILFLLLVVLHFLVVVWAGSDWLGEGSITYFSLFHRMIKVVSSGLFGLGLYLVVQKDLIHLGELTNGNYQKIDPELLGFSIKVNWFYGLTFLLFLGGWIASLIHFAIGAMIFGLLIVLLLLAKKLSWEWRLVACILSLECCSIMLVYHYIYNLNLTL